jgi:lipopolysaccharide/colanic/teichoic acid biosynthesis glycosyltransferase
MGAPERFSSEVRGRKTDYMSGMIQPQQQISRIMLHPQQRRVKRAIDLILGSMLLIGASPVMLTIAAVIWICEGGPILYEWRVVGQNGQPFISWKFRTMSEDADRRKQDLLHRNEMQGPVFKIREDPRITHSGRFLRKYSLDELPQLWSVVTGDMSLVGPRPPLVTEYSKFQPWQRRKLSVRPGLTCLWQVNGRADIKDFDDWIRMDLDYIDHWSLMLDLRILLQTVFVVLRGEGAY